MLFNQALGIGSALSPFEAMLNQVFGNGENGTILDPGNIASMWQDAAMTVPVTADGDRVRVIQDISGHGNHATASSDAERPTYRANGGKPYLEFSGSNSLDFAGSALKFANPSAHVGFHANATVMTLIGWPHASTHTSPYYRMLLHTTTSDRVLSHWNGGSQLFSNAGVGWVAGNATAGVSPANGTFWANGAAKGGATAVSPITYPNPSVPVMIGRGASNVDRLSGKLFGVVVFNRATILDDALAIHRWLSPRYA